MAHEVEQMAYRGEVPWHGLGTRVEGDASIDEWLRIAGLDWEVQRAPVTVMYKDSEGRKRQFTDPSRNVIFRETEGGRVRVFDTVGSRYVPFQNAQILDFFREYVEAGDASIETAGSLRNGEWIWALAKLHEGFELRAGDGDVDRVEGYVLLANPHTSGKAAQAKVTSVRVVCMNTLTASLSLEGARGREARLWHNNPGGFTPKYAAEAKQRLGIARAQLQQQQAEAELLVQLRPEPADALGIIAKYFDGDPALQDPEEQPRRVQKIWSLYQGEGYGSRLATAANTGWGVLNAVTQYLDHDHGRSADTRISNAWLGAGEVRKRRVKEDLLALTA